MNQFAKYSVVWTTPSRDSSGSMPTGNGDLGANVWMEDNGELRLLIGKTDAWSEFGQLLKLGRLRLRFQPSPLAGGSRFSQRLDLEHGEIVLSAGALTVRVWVDAHHPVIRIEVASPGNFEIEVSLELWRTERLGQPISAVFRRAELYPLLLETEPQPLYAAPDVIVPATGDRIVWYRRNEGSIWPETLRLQALDCLLQQQRDPLDGLTMGGCITGDGLMSDRPGTLRSREPRTHFGLGVHALTVQTASVTEFERALSRQVEATAIIGLEAARAAHRQWWRAFWQRSWIWVSGDSDAETVTRGYLLQRFMNACAGRGRFPIKFNGSIFNVDRRNWQPTHLSESARECWQGRAFDADFRRWGGAYWLQNTRHAYWAMLAAGDFDLMKPYFEMFRDALPLAMERTRRYFGHRGAFFPECMYFWGTYLNGSYGWERDGKSVGEVESGYFRHHFQGGLEMLAIGLHYHAFTGDEEFLQDTLLPLAEQILFFYDEHYPRDRHGRLRLDPANALESYHDVVNPTQDIAGLRCVLDGLIALPVEATSPTRRQRWQRLRGELPPFPIGEQNGKRFLLVAEQVRDARPRNIEAPELWAVFPFRQFGIGLPDLDLARETFARRSHKRAQCWSTDEVWAALLGLAEQARAGLIERFADTVHSSSRFPAFWWSEYDWAPDQDHGCSGMIALQTMLLQHLGKKLVLFPAWPADWNVEFKLHAPDRAIVAGEFHDGAPVRREVTPVSRHADLAVFK